jgi:hypothetical protein
MDQSRKKRQKNLDLSDFSWYNLKMNQPKLFVWFGSMAESNGKKNWTAILHRGDITRGFSFARSEYHDRVRYDADCMRYLIGDLDVEPFILDYDSEMLSPE